MRSTPSFLSTPSARRATALLLGRQQGVTISIHALREEGDLGDVRRLHSRADISIHALREEGDALRAASSAAFRLFLSTPSARRATYGNVLSISRSGFLSTPSARRATLSFAPPKRPEKISIHALREEGDLWPLRPS